MTTDSTFSQRFGLRPVPNLSPQDVPDPLRVRLASLIGEMRSQLLPPATDIGRELACVGNGTYVAKGDMKQINELLLDLEWWQFYDAVEHLLTLAKNRAAVADKIDTLFKAEGVPYSLTPEGIEWRHSEPARRAVLDAEEMLSKDDRFEGPCGQWVKARKQLAARPPDVENCIKDAVGAMEGVAKILATRGDGFRKLVKMLSDALDVHPALADAMSKVYAYRGDEHGVAHGATKPVGQVTLEAELVLHWTAAAIVYLIAKYDRR